MFQFNNFLSPGQSYHNFISKLSGLWCINYHIVYIETNRGMFHKEIPGSKSNHGVAHKLSGLQYRNYYYVHTKVTKVCLNNYFVGQSDHGVVCNLSGLHYHSLAR